MSDSVVSSPLVSSSASFSVSSSLPYDNESFEEVESVDVTFSVRDGGHEAEGDQDEYGDDAFEAEDNADDDQPPAVPLVREDDKEEEEGVYGPDWEEDQDHGEKEGDDKENEYGDDAFKLDGSIAVDNNVGTVTMEVKTSSVDHRDLEAWCHTKLYKLSQRQRRPSQHTDDNLPSRSPPHPLPSSSTVDALLHKLKQRRSTIYTPRPPPELIGVRNIPSALVERARVQQLLHWSALGPPPVPIDQPTEPRSLVTFASVKTADVRGQLATLQLDAMLARWTTDASDAASMSIATMEFVHETLATQRRVLRDDHDSHPYLFHALKPQTTADNASTIQDAQLAVHDSIALRRDAERVLRGRDAVPCRCFNTLNADQN